MTVRLLKLRYLWLVGLCALAIFAVYRIANATVAPQHLPWKRIDLNAPVGWATRLQLLKLAIAPRAQCLDAINAASQPVSYAVLPEKRNDQGCGWQVALETTLAHDTRFYPADVTALCPITAANYIWLRGVEALAEQAFASKLARVHHFGTYSCRNVAGTSRLSEHAFANAWDIAGFELEDGRLISVLKDWDGDPVRARFLRDVRDEACGLYRVVLSPDYNAAHADHFHFDMGPSSTCR